MNDEEDSDRELLVYQRLLRKMRARLRGDPTMENELSHLNNFCSNIIGRELNQLDG